MAEAAFAQSFLSALDSRPIQVSADHVEDAKNFPARPPYILPRMPKPMSKSAASKSAPGQERSITAVLKSLRNPPLDIKLTSQPLNTSMHDIKAKVHSQTRIPVEKMKILHNKKPVPDSKVLKDVIGDSDNSVEFSIMVMGGAAAIPPEEAPAPPTETTGAAALVTDEFWSDLKGFLMQRLKDQAQAEELSKLFKSSWESSRSEP